MILERFPEIVELPPEEKRLLINELCEQLHAGAPASPDPAIVKILEERWRAFESDPSGAVTIEEFRKRLGG